MKHFLSEFLSGLACFDLQTDATALLCASCEFCPIRICEIHDCVFCNCDFHIAISAQKIGDEHCSPLLFEIVKKLQTRKTLLFFLPSQIIIEDDGATDNCIRIRMSCEIEILLSFSAQSAFHTQIINSRADNCT